MTEHIYRSDAPEILAAWDTWCEAIKKWCADRDEALTTLDPTGKRAAIISTGFGRGQFVGLSHEYGDPIPEGWRKHPKSYDVIIPLLKTKTGKAAAKLIASVQPPARPKLAGMPPECWVGLSIQSPGIQKHGEYIYALWSGEEPVEKVDPKLWEPVKRSAWYALLEAEEADA